MTVNTMIKNVTLVNNAAEATVVTHNGVFHGDETMAIAMLSCCLKNVCIMRTGNPADAKEAAANGAIIVDVGGQYDPEKNFFDHHQWGFSETYEDGTKLSSAGLIWRKYGEEICSAFGCLVGREKEAAEIVERSLVHGIDAGDTGKHLPDGAWSIYNFLGSNNRTYRETNAPDPYAPNACVTDSELFLETCELAYHILWRAVEKACSIVYGRKKVEKVIDDATDAESQILELPSFIEEWKETVIKSDDGADILYGIYEDALRHQWVVAAVPPALDQMNGQRKPLPETWRGKSAAELQEVSGVTDAIFCHIAGFMCTAKSRDGALRLAQLAVEA